jgi:hypothetical protein
MDFKALLEVVAAVEQSRLAEEPMKLRSSDSSY